MLDRNMYLGLPTVVGKNKRQTLAAIKENMWNKIKGRHRGLFSVGLYICQSYSTSCANISYENFQVPKFYAETLWFLVVGFRWGFHGAKKISWIEWKMFFPQVL